MAASEATQQVFDTVRDDEKKLKYLDFVRVAAIYAVVCFSILYEYAKENSGPLKPGVKTVEENVKAVLEPIYEKFIDVPMELLKFVDGKVDDFLKELDGLVPSLLKKASYQARVMATEVQRAGVIDAAKSATKDLYAIYEPTARGLCSKYEPVAEKYAVSAWRSLNRIPLFPQLAQIAVPTAAYWSEKYNDIVCYAGNRGYGVVSYVPLVPIERISKVFEEGDSRQPTAPTNGNTVMMTDGK